MGKLSEYYDLIIVDTTSECFFEYTKEVINISDQCIFLTEANLLDIKKSIRILKIFQDNWKIKKEKIKIIFNKYNKNSIDEKILKNIFYDYEILGKLYFNNKYNLLINKNMNKGRKSWKKKYY